MSFHKNDKFKIKNVFENFLVYIGLTFLLKILVFGILYSSNNTIYFKQ